MALSCGWNTNAEAIDKPKGECCFDPMLR